MSGRHMGSIWQLPEVPAVYALHGGATAFYSKTGRGVFDGPVVGRTWTPPGIAGQRLRDCLHRPYSLLRMDGWCASNSGRPAGGA